MLRLNALNIYQLNLYQILVFMFKAKNNLLPNTFSSVFTNVSHKYTTRYATDACVQTKVCTKQTCFRIYKRGPTLWNKLKFLIPTADTSLTSFKKTLKSKIMMLEDETIYF